MHYLTHNIPYISLHNGIKLWQATQLCTLYATTNKNNIQNCLVLFLLLDSTRSMFCLTVIKICVCTLSRYFTKFLRYQHTYNCFYSSTLRAPPPFFQYKFLAPDALRESALASRNISKVRRPRFASVGPFYVRQPAYTFTKPLQRARLTMMFLC